MEARAQIGSTSALDDIQQFILVLLVQMPPHPLQAYYAKPAFASDTIW